MTPVEEVLSGARQWAAVEADCREVFLALPRRSVHHVIADFPFSAHVHGLQRRMKRGPHAGLGVGEVANYGNRTGHRVAPAALGFGHLTDDLRRFAALHSARVARRWILLKADETTRHHWQTDLEAAGVRHVRAGVWLKLGAQPQLSGDRPAVPLEFIEIAHSRGERLRWNGGGKHARWNVLPDVPAWEVPIATDRNGTGARVHTTQTPLDLWLQILEDFTDAGEVVFDPTCGSGSLGIACARMGRRYIGVDNGKDANGKPWAEWARDGIEAELAGSTRAAHRAGQLGLFATK